MDEITIGARLRTLRRWRRMTQAELAGLAGLSPSFLSMVETGHRPLDRRSHIAALANALKISETDLVGGPHLSADRQQADPHGAIPALREAFLTNTLTCPAIDSARPLPELAAAVIRHIEPARIRCDYIAVGQALPGVLDELHWHIATRTGGETASRVALETLIEACVTATLVAKNLGYMDLAHVAALRAQEAATLLDDPVQQGKADLTRIWALPRERPWERKLAMIERAADDLEAHAQTPLGTQVLGLIALHAALAGAVVQRAALVSHWLGEADRLASRVPDDMAGTWQSFSRTNVGVWRVAIGVERGESGGAVRRPRRRGRRAEARHPLPQSPVPRRCRPGTGQGDANAGRGGHLATARGGDRAAAHPQQRGCPGDRCLSAEPDGDGRWRPGAAGPGRSHGRAALATAFTQRISVTSQP